MFTFLFEGETSNIANIYYNNSVRTSNNAIVEIWTRKLSCICGPCSSNEWDDCESTDWVDRWDRVSLLIGQFITMELS
jgi:hypothetical protein